MSFHTGALATLILALTLSGCDSGGGSAAPDGSQPDAVADAVLQDLGPDAGVDTAPSPDTHGVDPRWPDPAEVGARSVLDPAAAGFFELPFPFDLRRHADGRPDLTGFPNPFDLAVVDSYVEPIEAVVDGFSPAGTVYLRFDAPLDPDAFPTPEQTTTLDGDVVLASITPSSPTYGIPVPVEMAYYGGTPPKEGYYLQPYLLMVKPLQGFPLREGEKYVLIVRRELEDAEGRLLGAAELLERILKGEDLTAAETPVRNALSPALDWLDGAEIPRGRIAALTVFTTARPTRELEQAAKFVRTQLPAPKLVGAIKKDKDKDNHVLYKGVYVAPNFQAGELPYDHGGNFVFDAQGNPKVQWDEEITFLVSVPKTPMPADGWPLVMYSHGTGGSYKSFTYSMAARFSELGVAVIGIDQPLHGERYHGPPINVDIYSFNFINIDAGRTNFRQAVLDNVSLTRFVQQSLEFPTAAGNFRVDPTRVGFFGHSHGGLVGGMFVPLEPFISSAVISSGGGGLAYTLILRKQIDGETELDLQKMIATFLGIQDAAELTVFHPMINLLQMGVDVTDPINFAPHFYEDRFRDTVVPVLITEGLDDPYTPAITVEGCAIGSGIPVTGPLLQDNTGFKIKGLDPVDFPVSDNIITSDGLKVTAGLVQFEGFGHFPVFDSEDAISIWKHFVKTSLVDLAPEIDYED